MTSENVNVTGYNMLHMNWGDYGDDNGWFTISYPWTVGNATYTCSYILSDIYYKN